MKRFLSFLLVALVAFAMPAKSQTQLFALKAGDTIIATSALDTVTKILPASAGYSSLAIQVNATKLSGTVSLKAYLYVSLDAVNYTVTDSSTAFVDQTTNVVWFTKTAPPYTYYKTQIRPATGAATTQSVICRVYYAVKRYDGSL